MATYRAVRLAEDDDVVVGNGGIDQLLDLAHIDRSGRECRTQFESCSRGSESSRNE